MKRNVTKKNILENTAVVDVEWYANCEERLSTYTLTDMKQI